jgi:hypothetical protein
LDEVDVHFWSSKLCLPKHDSPSAGKNIQVSYLSYLTKSFLKTPLYSPRPFPLTRYWPFPHNMTQYAIEMSELVAAGNRLWDLQVPAEIAKLPGAKGALFSSFDLVGFLPFYVQR